MVVLQMKSIVVFSSARMIAARYSAIKLCLHVDCLDVTKKHATITEMQTAEFALEDIRAEIEVIVELWWLWASDFAAWKWLANSNAMNSPTMFLKCRSGRWTLTAASDGAKNQKMLGFKESLSEFLCSPFVWLFRIWPLIAIVRFIDRNQRTFV